MEREVNKTTVLIINKAQYLSQSTGTQLEFVSPLLNDFFNRPAPSEGPDTPPVDYRAAQQSNIVLLDEGIQEVQEKSQAHRIAKIETSNALRERDVFGREITGRFRGLRSSAKASYKERWLLLGLVAPPETDHTGMYERCRDLHEYLLDPQMPIRLGDPEDGQPAFDFPQLASTLGPRLDLYKQSLDRWVEAKKQRDDALISKRAAVKRLRSLYANIARIQEGYFRLAGLEELADRIRLTIPRSSPKQSLAEPTPTTEPTPDTEPTPTVLAVLEPAPDSHTSTALSS